LEILRYIGENHGVNIAEVASQYILQKPMVGGVIIGARNKNHLTRLEKITSFELDDDDIGLITSIVNKSEGPKGPVYDLERDKEGRHGRIMRYNLNED